MRKRATRCIARPTDRRFLPYCLSPEGWAQQIINGAFEKTQPDGSPSGKPGSRDKKKSVAIQVANTEFLRKGTKGA